MNDFAPLQRLTRLILWVGLEERPHLVGHPHELMVALLSERRPELS